MPGISWYERQSRPQGLLGAPNGGLDGGLEKTSPGHPIWSGEFLQRLVAGRNSGIMEFL